MRYVDAVVDALAPGLTRRCLVVGKSTVPVGTARRIAARIASLAPAAGLAELAWNPEFLREGHAVQDSLSPDRLVFGVTSEWSAERLREVYAIPLAGGVPGLVMDLETAELVKVAANSFLATKISFINAMAEVCEAAGADVTLLAGALAHDERIGGKFLSPGLGFGGGCLPKDIRAFRAAAQDLGVGSVAGLLARGRRDQHEPPRPGDRPGPGSRRRRPGRQAGRGARRGVQAGQRRRARLAQPRRVRPPVPGGRGGQRARPGGHQERRARSGRTCGTPRP